MVDEEYVDKDKQKSAGESTGDSCRDATPPLPEINFSTFVFSMGSSVLINLGELPDPSTQSNCINLPIAKQSIDILAMLQEKTKGNLNNEEENLLTNLLYELKMKYVAAVKK